MAHSLQRTSLASAEAGMWSQFDPQEYADDDAQCGNHQSQQYKPVLVSIHEQIFTGKEFID